VTLLVLYRGFFIEDEMYTSKVVAAGAATEFPAFNNERHYMIPFTMEQGLPDYLQHFQPVVNQMLLGVTTEEEMYIMIDQKKLTAGEYHRRPGLHIDGYWNPGLSAHGGGHMPVGSHGPIPVGGHTSTGGHGHYPAGSGPLGWGIPSKKAPTKKPKKNLKGWDGADFDYPEGLILASNVTGCALGLDGVFEGPIGEGGDCSKISTGLDLSTVVMGAGVVYHGNVTMLHETLPAPFDCERTLIRINVPGWTP
jgi:hypothetical protein